MNTEKTTNQPWHYQLNNRYVFRGQLVMQTALHIGGGRLTLSNSNSPVVLTPDQKPFIPGSSFKGAFRSAIEKIVPGLPEPFFTCALIGLSEGEPEDAEAAPYTPEDAETAPHTPRCSTLRQKDFSDRKRNDPSSTNVAAVNREALAGQCDTCRLFGSPYAAARLNVNDLYMSSEEWQDIIQIRDGVAIDRDTEKAKDRLKYNFEVVPASAAFMLEIVLENATPRDLQLACVGLNEFVHGFGVVGGKRSRGLGVSRLEHLTVYKLELNGEQISKAEKLKRLQQYLLKGSKDQFMDEAESKKFLEEHINRIFRGVEEG